VRVLTGVSDLTLDELIELAYDPYLPGFEQLIPGLIQAFDESGQDYPELTDEIDVLRAWDFKVSVDSVAMSLAHFYGTQFREDGESPKDLSRSGLISYFGTESPHEERLRIFSTAVSKLETDFGQSKTAWGEINRFQRISGDIDLPFNDDKPSLPVGMASGRWGALASFGARGHQETKRIYGSSGNSFVAVVEFGDRVRAKTLLAGGQNSDPDSPHFDDQAQRYVDREFKDVAFYREDVERRATRTYHPGDI
jgi:acyl-homoserine lactone acylase PvdQ